MPKILVCQTPQMCYMRTRAMLDRAAGEGCELVVLPEGCVAIPPRCVDEYQLTLENAALRFIADWARDTGVGVVLALLEAVNGRPWRRACVSLGIDGTIMAVCRQEQCRPCDRAIPTSIGIVQILFGREVLDEGLLLAAMEQCPALVLNICCAPPELDVQFLCRSENEELLWKTWKHLLCVVESRVVEGFEKRQGVSFVRVDQPLPIGFGSSLLVEPHRTMIPASFYEQVFHVEVCVPEDLPGRELRVVSTDNPLEYRYRVWCFRPAADMRRHHAQPEMPPVKQVVVAKRRARGMDSQADIMATEVFEHGMRCIVVARRRPCALTAFAIDVYEKWHLPVQPREAFWR
mmetsp:Transcript_107134/g.245258  ORF Transcript_107134/g.245258 Transcript_107134/m.245258 type:complete len:347 (+) Transcript_107134:28-1068(+)